MTVVGEPIEKTLLSGLQNKIFSVNSYEIVYLERGRVSKSTVMEQIYMIEIFIDKVTIFVKEDEEPSAANKNLIIKVKFGPKEQFIIKESQLAKEDRKDDIIESDEKGRRKWTRTIRVGKSFLFPSFPDTVQMMLNKFPLEIEVWNDDENETQIYVGNATMIWDTQFYHMLREATNPKVLHDPLTIKQLTKLYAECCCSQCGEITFILRLAPLGESITTEFQQLMKDPDAFVFRTNKAPSTFQCKRIEGDDPNFNMIGSLYETATLEDPEIQEEAKKKIEICTELQSCGNKKLGDVTTCEHHIDEDKPKKYPIDKIRMGDITGPCGNTNCQLAHKVKTYIRALDTYKAEAAGKVTGNKDENITKKVCGGCSCKDDRFHRDTCPDKTMDKVKCKGCGGAVHAGDTCEERRQRLFGTGATPSESKTRVGYVLSVPNFKDAVFRKDYIVENMEAYYNNQQNQPCTSRSTQGCCCKNQAFREIKTSDASSNTQFTPLETRKCTRSLLKQVYNISTTDSKRKVQTIYNCTQTPADKDCKCDPVKPQPPCNTFDCDCITEIGEKATRKTHKPYCPLYKHKAHCPILTMDEEEKLEEDEDETEPLPYGLPPIQLGPCPVLGRPCTVPDGFARMYRNAVLPTLPPSYDDAGKVCCSKEYERIKKAIKQYMKNEKNDDFRCINKFNVDVETRCCDKEQRLKSLMGKGCCGSHKMAIQDKYAEK